MNTSNRNVVSQAPQRRNLGTRISTAENVSTMPSSTDAGRVSSGGTFNCESRTANPGASVIFQRPADRNSADVSTAPVQLNQLFQLGNSKRESKSPECAILSSMILILALFSGLMGAQTADMAVTGARIHTLDPQKPVASAIAVKDGKVLAVGENVEPYLGPSTRRIDAKGAAIIPGLIDSHVHMRNFGDSLEILDLRATKTAEQIAAMVRTAARGRKPGEWIRGRSWDQTVWPSRQFPDGGLLSSAAPDNPVFLTRVDGHAAWVNRKALEIADVNAATPDPPGGRILHGPAGAPTGVLIDRAQSLVSRHIPAADAEQTAQQIARAARECARLGLTSVHDAGVSAAELAAYRRLIAEHKLPLRVYAMIGGEGALWRDYLKRGPEISDRLTVRSIKLMSDGALGSRGAALLAPYSDDPANTGLLILQKSDIERVAREAVAHGFQVNTH